MIADGHIHTPFCPHGTKDSFEDYIERAIDLGYKEMTFTEHAPLPRGFIDPTPTKDSAMDLEDIEKYFTILSDLQKRYQKEIKINKGLEIDYIEGYEEKITDFLNTYGPFMDDSILSVHFLKKDTNYYCIDYSAESFGKMIATFETVDAIYQKYFHTLQMSIQADLGNYKPNRIGHITLAYKFQQKYPAHKNFEQEIRAIIKEMSIQKLQLDYNGAGVNKPHYQQPYPPQHVMDFIKAEGIAFVYGSDAHQASDLGQGLEQLDSTVLLQSPTFL
ncbi:histidinol-phosphatase HisJ [Bacillus salitolerans]|uniref:Histidinol-phosphatase n=1 Tax=Bacillus salitolerans TaxID=1437434 RepID=A0ABW4LW81_9BACI